MPFFLFIVVFLAGAFVDAFLANFLFAACIVFMPCLSFGLPQPQVAHITSSSFVEQRSQIFLACRLYLHQASSALETSSLQSSLQSSCKYPYILASHIFYTYYFFFFLEAAALSTRFG